MKVCEVQKQIEAMQYDISQLNRIIACIPEKVRLDLEEMLELGTPLDKLLQRCGGYITSYMGHMQSRLDNAEVDMN